MENSYKEDQVVKYSVGLLKGKGKIKGIATVDMPYIGKQYIVEDLSGNIPNQQYPYTHMVVFEIHLTPE